MKDRFQFYREAIAQAQARGLVKKLDFLTGYSGEKLLGTLQRFADGCAPDEVYCEIGVFQGLSLISVAAANPAVQCIGIDNFAYFDEKGINKRTVLERKEKAGAQNVELVDMDYEDALESFEQRLKGRKIGVFFVDGPHDYRSQIMCLLLALPHLSDTAVIVVDDSNYAHVRQANRDFLTAHREYKLLWEHYTGKHPNNMTKSERAEAVAGWWNGVNIMVKDSNGILPYREPLTVRNRTIFENENVVHPMRFSDTAIEAVRFANALRPFKPRVALGRFRILLRAVRQSPRGSLPHEELNMIGLDGEQKEK